MNARPAWNAALAAFLALGPAAAPCPGEGPSAQQISLRTVEGTVVDLSTRRAEGDLQVVAVALETEAPSTERLELLLAPGSVLDEIAFDVERGDRLRARVFVADEGPLKVHKAMNLTRGTMVRFRSLRQVPLWGTAGDWGGGACRRQGGHGGGHGGGPRR